MNSANGSTSWKKVEAPTETCKKVLSDTESHCQEQTQQLILAGALPAEIKVGYWPEVDPTVVYFSPGCGGWADELVAAHGGKACPEPAPDSVAWEYCFEAR